MSEIIRRATDRLSIGVERYMPHSFIFVILLTVVAYVFALMATPSGPFEIVEEWYGEFWGFLEFTMQMTLIIVTGYGVASAPATKALLKWIASAPNSATQAYLSVVIIGSGLGYVNWGLGLVGAAFYAITIAAYREDVDFGYLIATAYIGIWPGIIGSVSITAPILVNTPDHFLEDQIGLIPLTETIYSPIHLSVVITTLLMTLLLIYLMRPPESQVETLQKERLPELIPDYSTDTDDTTEGISDRINRNPVFTAIITIMGAIIIISIAVLEGVIAALNLNSMNFLLLMLGLALHKNPISYVRAVRDGVERASQVILQFPFYGGIQGILIGTGLAALIVDWFVGIANPETFPALTFLATGFLNIFVPSAGGQYIVMGEILHDAGSTLGTDDPIIVSAYTIGDGWTNMLQPFWALPLVGIAGLQIRDIWGYVMVGMIIFGLTAGGILLLFPVLGVV